MKKKVFTAMVFCFLPFGVFNGAVLAAPADNFTSKMVVNAVAMPMAKMGLKSRVQTGMMQDIYTITDSGTQKTFMVNPQSKTYYEQVSKSAAKPRPFMIRMWSWRRRSWDQKR